MDKIAVTIKLDKHIRDHCKRLDINFSQTCNEILTQKLEDGLEWVNEMLTFTHGHCHCCKTNRTNIFVIHQSTQNIFEAKVLFGNLILKNEPFIEILLCENCIQKPLKEVMEKINPSADCNFIDIPDTALEFYTTMSNRKKTGKLHNGAPTDFWIFPFDEYVLEYKRMKLRIKDGEYSEEEDLEDFNKLHQRYKDYITPTPKTP